MEFKKNDFVKITYNLYANEELVQSTDKKLNEDQKLGPQTIIIGQSMILKALDEDIEKLKDKKSNTLNLSPENAYGKRDKKLFKTFPKSVFDEQKLRAVAGMVYDFNGTFGTVKSVVGGRVMVDFNHLLAGKDIKIDYEVKEKIDKIDEKIKVVFSTILRLPENTFDIKVSDKNITLKVPEQITKVKNMLIKSIEDLVPEIKEYSIKIENFKKERN